MSLIDAIMGANMAENSLIENGQVGYSEYTRGRTVAHLPEEFAADYPFDIVSGAGILMVDGQALSLVEGRKYEVILDGKTYQCYGELNGNGVFLGSDITNMPDTPEAVKALPYPFNISDLDGSFDVVVFNEETTHSFSIYEMDEVVHPIASKYIEGVTFPLVELETVVSTEGETALSEGDIAKLSVAMDAKMPAVIRFGTNSGTNTCSVFNYLGMDGMRRLSTTMDGVEIMFVNMGDQWVCGVQPLT